MDCSKTINFLSELKRLCDSRDECVANEANKEDCPMFGVCSLTHSRLCAKNIKTAIKTVQKWSNEHPKKTYAQDFFEKFPKAPRCKSANGRYPSACRKSIYDGKCPHGVVCEECWNEPMEE